MSKPELFNVEHAFNPKLRQAQADPELRQAQADMDAYLEQNPYQDEKGVFRNPVTGDFISTENAESYYSYGTPADFELYELKDASELKIMADEAFKSGDVTTGLSILEQMGERISPDDLSVTELARLSAWAEWRGRGSAEDEASKYKRSAFKNFMETVDTTLLDKIDAIGMHDDYAERDGSIRDVSRDGSGEHKSELDRYYDRLMKFRDDERKKLMSEDAYEQELAMDEAFKKGDHTPIVLPGRTKEDGWKELTVEQATHMNDVWNEQTGQVQEDLTATENTGVGGNVYHGTINEVITHEPRLDKINNDGDPADDEIGAGELDSTVLTWADDPENPPVAVGADEDPLDSIILPPANDAVNSGAPLDSGNKWGIHEGVGSLAGTNLDIATDPENSVSREKTSRRKKIAAAIIGLASVVGIGALVNSLGSDDAESNDATVVTEAENAGSDTENTTPESNGSDLNLGSIAGQFGGDTDTTTPEADEEPADEGEATNGDLDLSGVADQFGEDAEAEESADEESADEDAESSESDTSEADESSDSEAESDNANSDNGESQSLGIDSIILDEGAEPMEAGEGNTAWDRARDQGLDMNRFVEATGQTVDLYNEYATNNNLEKLEFRDGNIWTAGTNRQISPEQYAIYAQIQQDVVAWMTGANPNSPFAK